MILGILLKKKVLITAGVSLSVFILTWITFIFLFPVSVIEGETYNTNKLKELSKQRALVYDELYSSLYDEINKILYNLYLRPIDNENTGSNETEKVIIYNGDISLLDKISEYNLLYLTKEELRILRNTIFAQYGYIFQSKDLFEHFNGFAWYNPQYNNVDERLTEYDQYIIGVMLKLENEQIDIGLQSILEIFYSKSINTDKFYLRLINECKNNISFPLQNKKQHKLKEVFPAYIHVVEHNGIFYNQFALDLFLEQYEDIIERIIEAKTNDFLEYIDFYLNYFENELLTISDSIEYQYNYNITVENVFDYYINQCLITRQIMDTINCSYAGLLNDYLLNIPVTKIDNNYYSLFAINELRESMKIISPYLVENTKRILINGVYYQTEIYSNNIGKYADWYYSYFTSIAQKFTNIIGFITGNKSTQEKYYNDNFNRIMNNNANLDGIIEHNMNNLIIIIENLFMEYLELKECFSVNNHQVISEIITADDFIEPYIEDIVVYFENVHEALDNANNYLQEYTINDRIIVKTARFSLKLLPGANFFGGILIDYLSLKSQELLNRSVLEQQIFDSMLQNQKNKIAIINDPFNYLSDKLSVGSVIFADNYFVGYSTYQHYGVYIGNGRVIHFAAPERTDISPENGIIHETTLEKFLNGRALQIDLSIEKVFPESEIIQRAHSRLGEKGYDLFTNNCEHFARWCVTDEHVSYQIDNLPQKIDSTFLIIQENLNMVSKFMELFDIY